MSLVVAMLVQHICQHIDPLGTLSLEHSIYPLRGPIMRRRHTPHIPHPREREGEGEGEREEGRGRRRDRGRKNQMIRI